MKTQNTKHKTQNTKHKTQNTKHKTHLSLAVSFALLSISQAAYAACLNSPHLVRGGDNCSYDASSYGNSDWVYAVVDVAEGSSATFTAADVTLQKYWAGRSSGSYAAVFLGKESDANKTNRAVFEGNVTVNEASNSRFPRDIIVSGGSNLLIKGDLTANHGASQGGIINVNATDGDWFVDNRNDTSMRVEGKTKLTIQGSGGTTAVRIGNGHLTFAGDVLFNSQQNAGENFWLQNDKGSLTFEKALNANVNKSFLRIVNNTDSTATFNGSSNIVNSGSEDTFWLSSGTTMLNGDTTINTANARVFLLDDTAKLNNNAVLDVTSNDGIAIHASPIAGKTVELHNNINGVINQAAGVGRNGGSGTFTVTNDGILISQSADVFTNTGMGIIDITNNGTLSGSLNNGSGTLNLTNSANGTWTNSSDRDSILGNVFNEGTIAFAPTDLNTQPSRTITVQNYRGGGVLKMNTQWNDDAVAGDNGTTVSDKLIIDTIDPSSGVTTVKINARNIGSITPKASDIHSDNVIEVANAHTGNMFVGSADTLGTQQAQLAKNGNNYYWTLKADNGSDLVNPDAVSYMLNTTFSLNMGLVHLGRLHQRIGGEYHNTAQTTQASDSNKRFVWTRLIGNHDRIQGKERFGASSKVIGWQIGADVHQGKTELGSQYHSGLMLAYSHGTHDLYDKFRSVNGKVVDNKHIAQSRSDMISVGGYHTRYSTTGAYFDFVGQLSWLQHHNTQAKQQGFATAFSAEVGKPYALSGNWYVEPQAQLVYQYQHLNGTTDKIGRHLHSNDVHHLTARLGGRLLWKSGNNQIYLTSNMTRPFGSTKIDIDGETLSENFNTWNAEVGLGTQWEITTKFHIYADARYIHSLGKGNQVWRNSDARITGYNANVGVRFSW